MRYKFIKLVIWAHTLRRTVIKQLAALRVLTHVVYNQITRESIYKRSTPRREIYNTEIRWSALKSPDLGSVPLQ